MIKDRSEEETIMRLLDQVFLEEQNSEYAKIKNRVYGTNYFHLADKYFGSEMNEDAKRCYLKAASFSPQIMLNTGWLRRFFGTLLGPRFYTRLKSVFKGR